MQFVCAHCGEVESVTANGYTLGHRTERGEPNELDLEGIEFRITIEDDELSVDTLDGGETYLSKFSDWEDAIANAVRRADSDDLICDCNRPVWFVEDEEYAVFEHDDQLCVLVETRGSPVMNVGGEGLWPPDIWDDVEDHEHEDLSFWTDRLRTHLDEVNA